MDSVPFALVSIVVGGLCAALLTLWRIVTKGNRLCEERDARHEVEKTQLKDMLFKRMDEERKRAEEREDRANKRTHEFSTVLDSTKEVIMRTVRLLRRYDPDPTPMSALEDPTPQEDRLRKPKRKESKDDETSAFFKV